MSTTDLQGDATKIGQDLLVSACGLTTSAITAACLWGVESLTGVALYSWMLWFVLPIGALLGGLAGASGYALGAWYFGHRPTRLLLANVAMVSVATFLLIHYFAYMTLAIEGNRVAEYVPFGRYLDMAVRSARLHVSAVTTGELGLFGYVPALLQMLGFAVGGFAAYVYLSEQPYCETCSRYLKKKGSADRFTADLTDLQRSLKDVRVQLEARAIGAAIATHLAFGCTDPGTGGHLKTSIEIRRCTQCERHWARFTVSELSGNSWRVVPDLTVTCVTQEIIGV